MSIDDVTDLTPRVRYVSGASQTVFAYPFPIFQAADLVVVVDDVEKTLTTHYTVSGEGEDLGGNVTFLTGQTAGAIVTIYRDTVIERLSDQQQNGPIASVTTNDEFDKAYTIMQELKAKIGRAIRFPFTAAATDAQTELNPLSSWFGKLLRFRSTDGVPEPVAIADLNGEALSAELVGGVLYPRTAAEIAAGVTPVNYQYKPGLFERYGALGDNSTNDYTAINNALLQAAQSGGAIAKGSPGNTYFISANTLAIPNNVTLDIREVGLRTTDECILTFGNSSILQGHGGSLETSGASGAAIKKTDTATPSNWYIYGFPSLLATSTGTAGSIGLDFTAAYKGYFEIAVEGYETNILGGAASATPQTYYNTLVPRITGTDGDYGIRLREGCNATLILHPQINGSSDLTYFLRATTISGLTIIGGYCEAPVDTNGAFGFLLDGATSGVTVIGTTLEAVTSANTNYALGGADTATHCLFYGIQCAGAWANSGKIMGWSSSGLYSLIGGAPSNQVLHLGQTTFPSGETNGTARFGKLFTTGKVSGSVSAAADTAYTFDNTGDGIGAEFKNNSATLTANRAVQVLNRVGGPGHVLAFQNNGSAAGGIVFCTGTPESQVAAGVGTLAVRTDGGASTTLYVKESGTGNTGWVAK